MSSSKSPEAGAGKGKEDFRRRRLSLTDTDAGMPAMDKANISPSASGGGRQRRLSMSPEMGARNKETPFPLHVVGTFSCHGVEPGPRSGETNAKINQDRGCVCYPFGPNPVKYALFCVFDGHGANGDKVSHYASNNIFTKLGEKLEDPNIKGPKDALIQTFLAVDGMLKKDKAIDAELSGTTAVVLLYEFIDEKKGKLWSANCGDSRAIMCSVDGTVADLTEDQKPNTPDEQKRIQKCGGYVSPPEEEWGGPARVWLDANMTLPGLAMARSIGDHLVDRVGVIAEPVVEEFEINTDKHDMIVMASDGVWEFIESDAAAKIMKKAKEQAGTDDATQEVTKLIETAAAKWRMEEGDYRDDITAICIKLKGIHKMHEESKAKD